MQHKDTRPSQKPHNRTASRQAAHFSSGRPGAPRLGQEQPPVRREAPRDLVRKPLRDVPQRSGGRRVSVPPIDVPAVDAGPATGAPRSAAGSPCPAAGAVALAPAEADEAPKDARMLGKSYLRGLDGLRAIAVLAVLLYHMLPNQFVGGYVGVDFFFVISGFLITYRILQKMHGTKPSFSLKEFWLRRIRRLVPAVILLVVVCVPLAALIYPELLVGAVRQVLSALTYTTNWVEIIHGSNYFDQANPMLFKNLWSVAVEEQFYLIWPPILLVLLVRRLSHRKLVGVAAGITVVSAVLMGVLANPENFTRVYYGTDTHCFGLALGILLAFVWDQEDGPLSREWLSSKRWVAVLPLVGLVGFCALVVLVPDTSRFTYPFGLFLASLCSLALVAGVVVRPSSLFTRAMELPPVRWLGTRSYGIYLWHWPLLVFGRILVPTALGTVQNLLVDVAFVVVSCVIAELSYRFVEEPFRRDGIKRTVRRTFRRAHRGLVGKTQVAATAALTVATVVAIVTAPTKTELQMQVEDLHAQQAEQQAQADQQPQSDEPTVEDPSADDQGDAEGEQPEGDTSSIPNYDPTQTTGVPSGATVTAIGDSLISGVQSGFNANFEGLNFLAEPIRQWDDAVQVVNDGLAQGVIRQNVILDFGTNGGVYDEQLVYQVLDALGPERRIVLYNIYSPSTFVADSNAFYAKVAEEYPNVYLADWYSVASQHPEYLKPDRTHPNMDGMYPFVDVAVATFSQS